MDLIQMVTALRQDGLPLYPTGTRPKGEGMELSPFLWDEVVEFSRQLPLSFGHPPLAEFTLTVRLSLTVSKGSGAKCDKSNLGCGVSS